MKHIKEVKNRDKSVSYKVALYKTFTTLEEAKAYLDRHKNLELTTQPIENTKESASSIPQAVLQDLLSRK